METKITIDAHSLYWYLDKDFNEQLSEPAIQLITEAEKYGIIYVPVIALMEIAYLIERGRINTSFPFLMSNIRESQSYHIVPIYDILLELAVPLKGMEIHDRLILATAMITNSVLISKDLTMRAGNFDIKVIW